ncbi:MAG: hypothetical protein GY851_12305, partial [bacterium]|nr:hypothetical protein [bacterium]
MWAGIVAAAVLVVAYVLWQLFTSSRDTMYGIRKSVLYFMQTVDLLIIDAEGKSSVLHGFMPSMSNMNVSAFARLLPTGVCVWPMDGAAKIMANYLAALSLFVVL